MSLSILLKAIKLLAMGKSAGWADLIRQKRRKRRRMERQKFLHLNPCQKTKATLKSTVKNLTWNRKSKFQIQRYALSMKTTECHKKDYSLILKNANIVPMPEAMQTVPLTLFTGKELIKLKLINLSALRGS